MNNQKELRVLFLEEFVKRMIIKSLPRAPQLNKRDGLLNKLEKVSAAPPALKIQTKYEETPPHLTKEFLGPEEGKEKKIEALPQQVRLAEPKVVVKTVQVAPLQKSGEEPRVYIMDALNPILADPSVQNINCPGPDRYLLVTRMGLVQSSNMRFAAEDINNFMKDISQKTRIPLLPGLFKVAYGNYIVTAVVSEFVGTKFIIERKPMVMQQFGYSQAPPRAQFR
jgi:hypothetical protein